MKHYFPKYCEKFRCIANLCPDSCCRDWDVVVDDTSFDFYNTATATPAMPSIRNIHQHLVPQ